MSIWNIDIFFETGAEYRKIVTAREIITFIKEYRKENKCAIEHSFLPIDLWLLALMFKTGHKLLPEIAITKSMIYRGE